MDNWRKWPINTIKKDNFPEHFKNIKNCPKLLYFRGNWNNELFNNSIGIVGSRSMSRYGREVVNKLVPDLVFNKINIISGFMYGIDSEAHKTTIESNGVTVAVLGGGLNYLYPSENDKLYSEILDHQGLVISEYENDFKPTLWSFPQRNRIVSGLSKLGVVVIEAGIKSGSLITAKIAKEQNRKVFAVPGPINSKLSNGTNWLIKNKQAKLIENVNDILAKVISKNYIQENIFLIDLNNDELKIRNILDINPLTIDELAREINQPINKLSSTISLMILKNLIYEENNLLINTGSNQQ